MKELKKNSSDINCISILGARQHNLKNINVEIPHQKLIVITGLSGSGKSSLAFDTIFVEGQRRYVESLSNYAKQFLEVFEKPDFESIDGLSPTISIQQKTTSLNPRSTVGTVTEIYDFLRLLYSRISTPFCYQCHKKITTQTAQQIVDQIFDLPENMTLSILSPYVRARKGEYQKEILQLKQKGFSRIRIDGETLDLSQDISLDKQKKHDIDVYIDRLVLRKSTQLRLRLYESVEQAIKLSEGLVKIESEKNSSGGEKIEILFSDKYACIDCGVSYPTPEPRTFSFNSPMGACNECSGLGYFIEEKIGDSNDEEDHLSHALDLYIECQKCKGTRLKESSLNFKIQNKNIAELCKLSILKLSKFFKDVKFSQRELLISDRILSEIKDRLSFLEKVGVDYLSLDRTAQTLSGGEAQRIRLAAQIGSSLVGVTYVLDEPSIGLHQKDNDKLLETLEKLRDMGNTVIVVEHDKDTINKADFLIDLGPGAGVHGGEIIALGSVESVTKNKKSLTGNYLSGELHIEVPKKRRKINPSSVINISGLRLHNLKDIAASFPLGIFTCITGISGSGKSSLILDSLYPLLMNKIYGSKIGEIPYDEITGVNQIDKVVDIDQSPIGRTPRSNPATYTGTFGLIRDLFSQLPESRMRGFKPGRFSFNVKGGRCERCQGGGSVKVEMHFLSDIYVRCDVCSGNRFNGETLSIKYKGKSISDVLNMTIEEASAFFTNVPSLKQKLITLDRVGLGYITLGQSATQLSGGEAQRMKLARELSKRATGKTLYILDEPSTGLHFDDVKKLIHVLQELVDQGNTVIVIEHNLEIIKTADYIIDLGPDGGENGGKIIATGTPEEVSQSKSSYTGKYLKTYLNN